METTIGNQGSVTTTQRSVHTQPKAAPLEATAAAPEKVETPQAVPAADAAQQPTLKSAVPGSGLTTYNDQDTGRLIVRVFDRESGDVLVEFPPERAFRSATAVLEHADAKAKTSIEA